MWDVRSKMTGELTEIESTDKLDIVTLHTTSYIRPRGHQSRRGKPMMPSTASHLSSVFKKHCSGWDVLLDSGHMLIMFTAQCVDISVDYIRYCLIVLYNCTSPIDFGMWPNKHLEHLEPIQSKPTQYSTITGECLLLW